MRTREIERRIKLLRDWTPDFGLNHDWVDELVDQGISVDRDQTNALTQEECDVACVLSDGRRAYWHNDSVAVY